MFVVNRFLRSAVGRFGFSCLMVLLFKVPLITGRFYGDDYLVYEANRLPFGYSSSFEWGFLQSGGGKYRPLFTPLLSILLRIFGNNYANFQIFNWVLLSFICLGISHIVLKLSGSTLASYGSAIAVAISPFTWYGQSSVHGVMEFEALLLFLLGVAFTVKYQSEKNSSLLMLAGLFLGAASFTHERYTAAVFATWIVVIVRNRHKSKTTPLTHFVFPAILLLHFILKSQLLGLNAFKGGGETSFTESAGLWIAVHACIGMLDIFGFSSGMNDYFSNAGYRPIDPWGNAGPLLSGRLLTLLISSFAITFLYINWRRDRVTSTESKDHLWLFGLLLLALLLPAATVQSRIETRWLLPPFVCLVLLLSAALGTVPHGTRKLIGLAFISVALLSAPILNFSNYSRFSYDRRLAQSVLSTVAAMAPNSHNWQVVIDSPEVSPWMFGYGRAFTQDSHFPSRVAFGTECDFKPRPCLRITTRDGSVQSKWVNASDKR